jgi:hypothetical protein
MATIQERRGVFPADLTSANIHIFPMPATEPNSNEMSSSRLKNKFEDI